MDVVTEQLLETWDIHARINHYFVVRVAEEAMDAAASKGRSVRALFVHMHNVRLMWLRSAAEDLFAGTTKLEPSADKDKILKRLSESDAAIHQLVDRGLACGKIKGFKPHPAAFAGYLISHESHHRGQAELALRISGKPLDDKTSYGLWEWGVR